VVETVLNNPTVEDVVAEKGQEDNTISESSQWEKILEVETEEEFYTNTGRPVHTVKEANVENTRRLYSFVGTHFYFWWWRSNVIVGSYELRTGVGYGHEGRNGCIGGK